MPADLSAIRARLNGITAYHPYEADTFADWTVEAGDYVTVSRDATNYKSPLSRVTHRWNGTHRATVNATGNEERPSIKAQSFKKYASGGYGMSGNQDLYWSIWSEDGWLNSTMFATASVIGAEMADLYNGLFSYLELTASHLLVQFWGMYDGLSSELELTRSRLSLEFHGLYDGLHSELEVTRSNLRAEFIGLYDGLHGELELTRSQLRVEFQGMYDGLSSELELTRSRLRLEFNGMYDGLRSELELTRSRLRVEFYGLYDGLSSNLELTRSRLRVEFYGLYDGLNSNLELTRSRLRVEFYGLYDGLNSNLELTRSRLRVEFYGLYDGLNSSFELTRSRLMVEFYGLYDGLSSSFELTRSRLMVQFEGLYDGLSSSLEVTRSQLRAEFNGMYDGLHGELVVTRSQLTAEFSGMYDGLRGELTVTRSQLTTAFSDYYNQMNSRLIVTASELTTQFNNYYSQLSATFTVTASQMATTFNDYYNSLNSSFVVTASTLAARLNDYYSGLSNSLTVTASSLNSTISNNYTGLKSYINQTVSNITLSAEKIYMYGNTTLAGLLTISGGDLDVSKNIRTSLGGNNYVQTNKLTLVGSGGSQGANTTTLSQTDISAMIIKAAVDTSTNTLQLWKKGDDPLGDPSITFSKAASVVTGLTGTWSGGVFPLTVKTSPVISGIQYTVGFTNACDAYLTVETNGDPTVLSTSHKYINVPYKIVEHITSPTTSDNTRYSSSLALVNASEVWNYGWTDALEYIDYPDEDGGTNSYITINFPSSTPGSSTTLPIRYTMAQGTGNDADKVFLKYGDASSAVNVAKVTVSGGGGTTVTGLTGTWTGGVFPLTVKTSPVLSGIQYTVGFTNASDLYLTVEKNGSPTVLTTNHKYINVPYKIVEHGNSDNTRYSSSLALVDASEVWEYGWGAAYDKVSVPWQQSGGEYMVVSTPASTSTGGTSGRNDAYYWLTADTNYAYIRVNGNTQNDTYVARIPISGGGTTVTGLTGTWSGGLFPLTVKTSPVISGVQYTIGFTNASDLYLTVEKNGDPAVLSSNNRYINVPYKIVEHGNSDNTRYSGSLALVNAEDVWDFGWNAARSVVVNNLPSTTSNNNYIEVPYPSTTTGETTPVTQRYTLVQGVGANSDKVYLRRGTETGATSVAVLPISGVISIGAPSSSSSAPSGYTSWATISPAAKTAPAAQTTYYKFTVTAGNASQNYYMTIDSSAVYDAGSAAGWSIGAAYGWGIGNTNGVTTGQNSVNINKGAWSNGQISFTKSAGTANTKGVYLTQGTQSRSGSVYTVPVLDKYVSSALLNTGFSVSIDTSETYNPLENEIDIDQWAYHSSSDPGSAWYSMPNNISITRVTGWYRLVVKARETKKWYKVYIDASGVAGSSTTEYNRGVNAQASATSAQFNVSSGSYYIEAHSSLGGTERSLGTKNYFLGFSKTTYDRSTKVQIQRTVNGVPTQWDHTHELLLSAYWDAAQAAVTPSGTATPGTQSFSYTVKIGSTTKLNPTFQLQLGDNAVNVVHQGGVVATIPVSGGGGGTTVSSVTLGSLSSGTVYNCTVTVGGVAKASTIDVGTAINAGKATGWYEYYDSSFWQKPSSANGWVCKIPTRDYQGGSTVWFNVDDIGYSGGSTPSASDISLSDFQVGLSPPSGASSATELTKLRDYMRNNPRTYVWFKATISGGRGSKWYKVATPN